MTVGEKIKQERITNGWTQSELAQMIGETRSAISKYESDILEPKTRTAMKMAKAFGISLEEIFGEQTIGASKCNSNGKTIGERIKAERDRKRMSQAGLARICGISPQMLCQYEKGDRNPKLDRVIRIAQALDVKPSDIDDRLKDS